MRISYSSLDTYKTCPLKYKFQEIDKIRAPKNIEAVFGGVIHSTLKYMFERSPLYPTLDQILDFFRNAWEEKTASFSMEEEGDKIKAYHDEGLVIIKRFYNNNHPWNFNVIDLESRFEAEIEDEKNGEKHTLAGIIDRVDKNHEDNIFEIIDYKTQKRMPSKDMIDQDLQMSIYHLGLLKRWPQLSPDKIKLSFYYLKHGEKMTTARSSEQIEKTKKTIIKTINEIEQRKTNNFDFPPYPSALCDWCGYRQMCPMWKHLYESKYVKLDDDQIKKVGEEYFELKKQNETNKDRLDELKSIIYGFMDDKKIERVFTEQGYLTRSIREQYSYDLEKIKEILESIGKWQEILDADEKKIDKLIPSLPDDIKEKILSLRSSKKITTLTASKKKLLKEDSEE